MPRINFRGEGISFSLSCPPISPHLNACHPQNHAAFAQPLSSFSFAMGNQPSSAGARTRRQKPSDPRGASQQEYDPYVGGVSDDESIRVGCWQYLCMRGRAREKAKQEAHHVGSPSSYPPAKTRMPSPGAPLGLGVICMQNLVVFFSSPKFHLSVLGELLCRKLS